MKMTKAERIFRDTYLDCIVHVKRWGFETNPDGRPVGFTGLSTEETTSRRTWNAISKYIEEEKEIIDMMVKYNVISADEAKIKRFALDMVQVTLENTIKAV